MQAKEHIMSKISHLFVIDPIETLNLKLDSSLRMACALEKAGHDVAVCTPEDIFWVSSEGVAACHMRPISFQGSDITSMRIKDPVKRSLATFHAIHMRKDPPYDLNYITCTWLLESASRKGVKVWNSPQSLRDLNEKLSIFEFPEYINDGLVSTQATELFSFLKNQAHGDAILKPLTLFGGRGILRLNANEMSEASIRQILEEETQNGVQHRLIQAFDKRIFDGEVRAFAVGGKPIAWCLKKPQGSNFLANTRSGATLESYTPTEKDFTMIENISQQLLRKGVFFVGFDIIGGCVSEINITSPRLLHSASDTSDYYSKIADIISSNFSS